ncbi:AGAP008193-PA-like protein [Anopheles sinensis]|uniref:AGAP008193-PA-like protein n=1 Tax=Anopheles sinensis TaxID=74873 RepID=A0A084VYB8_ANOSI|nr:AGAP008193-PA-like protein [Anopheles sinensis]
MYCAGGKDNVSACNGDSGGGMFFNISDTWYLRGIVSFSPTRPNVKESLCDSSKPTVFTDVTKYRKWISRYTNTTKWLKNLKPCKDSAIEKDTECNAATRFDNGFLLQEIVIEKNVTLRRFSLKGDQAFNGREVLTVNSLFGIDKDCVEGRFYWTDYKNESIFSAKYDGTDVKAFISKNLDAGCCAVDWISRRLYWVNYYEETIEVASLDNPDLRTTVLIDADRDSRIAVDPIQGKLYTTVDDRGIAWYNLDGSEPEMLLQSTGINGITVSITTGELCYVNEDTSKIECIDTRSMRIRTIVSNTADAYFLAATDDILYWTHYKSDTIEGINQQGVKDLTVLSQ